MDVQHLNFNNLKEIIVEINDTQIQELRKLDFERLDGKALVYAPEILGRVLAEKGAPNNLDDVLLKLDGCVCATQLKELSRHLFSKYESLSSPQLFNVYKLLNVDVSRGLLSVSKHEMELFKKRLNNVFERINTNILKI